MGLAVIPLLTLAAACGTTSRAGSSPVTTAATSATATTPTKASTAGPASTASTISGSAAASTSPTPLPVDPGTLPQTDTQPDPTDPQFQARIGQLWQAIVTDAPASARDTFFPLTAYRQIKAVSDPDADYTHRLIALYDLDISAAHRRVGPGATLVRVEVPDTARWMLPGTEYNKGPYWRVLGTRLIYRTAAGAQESFGITSLISWRGQWYPVHLGPFNRPAGTGAVTP